MSLRKLQHWKCQPTGYRTAQYSEPQMLATIEEERREGPSVGFGTLDEYMWKFTFAMGFRCTSAEYERASENAAKMLIDELYGPIKQEVRRAMSAIYGQDRDAAMEALGAILTFIEDD
jgi:hypothetical protein